LPYGNLGCCTAPILGWRVTPSADAEGIVFLPGDGSGLGDFSPGAEHDGGTAVSISPAKPDWRYLRAAFSHVPPRDGC